MAVSSSDFVNRVRELTRTKMYGVYDNLPDKDVYEYGKKLYPNIDVKPYEELPTQSVTDADTSPKTLNAQESWYYDKQDYFIDDNSAMVYKMAFNNSMSGMAYKFKTGVDRYPEVQKAMDAGEYNPGVLEEIYGGLLGMTFPLDALTFIGSAGWGKASQVLATRGFQKIASKELSEKFATSTLANRVVQSGAGLGFFTGGANTIAEMAHQSEEITKGTRDEFDEYGIVGAGMKGYLEGAALGTAIGGVGTGFAKARGKLEKMARPMTRGQQRAYKIGRLATSKPVDFTAEVGTFTAGHFAWHGAPRHEDGTLDVNGVFKNLAVNFGFLGGMKTAFMGAGKVFEKYGEKHKKMVELINEKIEKEKNDREVLKNKRDDADIDGNKTARDAFDIAIELSNKKIESMEKDFPIWEKLFKKTFDILDKNDLTDKEVRKKVMDENPTLIQDALNSVDGYVGALELIGKDVKGTGIIDILKKEFKLDTEGIDVITKQLTKLRADEVSAVHQAKKKIQDAKKLYEKDILELELTSPDMNVQGYDFPSFKKLASEKQAELYKDVYGKDPSKTDLTKKGKLTKAAQVALFKEANKAIVTDAGKTAISEGLKTLKGKKLSKLQEEIKKSGISENDQGIIADILNTLPKDTKTSSTIRELINYAKWLKNNKPGSSLLSSGRKQKTFIKEYIDSKLKSKKLPTDTEGINRSSKAKGLINRVTNNLQKAFKEGEGGLVSYLSDKVLPSARTRYKTPKGKTQPFVGTTRKEQKTQLKKLGKAGDIDLTPPTAKTDVAKRTIKDKVVELLFSIGDVTAGRPGEILKILVKDFLPKKGRINYYESKTRTEPIPVHLSKSIINKLKKHIKDNKLNPEESLFFKVNKDGKRFNLTTSDLNKIIRDASNKTKTDVFIEYRETGEALPISDPKTIGESLGRIFRTAAEEGLSTKEILANRQGKTSTKSVGTYVIKKGVAEQTKKARERKGEPERLESEVDFKGTETEKQKQRGRFVEDQGKEFGISDKDLLEIENLGRGKTLGQFKDGVIKLLKGEWQPMDFFHELVHFDEAYARKAYEILGKKRNKTSQDTKNLKNLKKTIELYEKLDNLVVKSEPYKEWQSKNRDKDSVEFYTDKVALEKLANWRARGVGARFVRYLKNLKSLIAERFLGGKFATDTDIARVLAKRLDKFKARDKTLDMKGATELIGGDRAKAEIIRFKSKDKETHNFDSLNKQYHAYQRKIIAKRLNGGESRKVIEADIREQRKNVTEYEGGWSKADNPPLEAMQKWLKFLRTTNLEGFMGDIKSPKKLSGSAKKDWLKNYRQYERDAWDWITPEQEVSILKGLGVKDGKITNTTPREIQKLITFAHAKGVKPQKNTGFNDMMIDHSLRGNDWGWLKRFYMYNLTPVWYAAEKMGASKLSNKMLEHFISEQWHIGKAGLGEQRILGHIGRKNMNRLSYVIDKQRWKERYDLYKDKDTRKDSGLTNNDIKFYNEIFDAKGNVKNTSAGKAYNEAIKMRDYYWNELVGVAEKHFDNGTMTRAQVERFKQEFKKKWVVDYFPRKLSKQFLKHYNPSDKWARKRVDELVEKEAKNQALDAEYKKGVTFEEALANAKTKVEKDVIERKMQQKRIELERDPDTRTIAEAELENMFEFSPQTARNRYLSKRGLKLPEFTEIETVSGTKKLISTYETGYAETLGDYTRTMSKYIATAEQYPEFTSMMRKYGFPEVKSTILDRRARNFEQADWLLNRVKDQMGIYKSELVSKQISGGLQKTATWTSKLALSFPTAGLKNIVVGTPQTMAAFGVIRTLGAMRKAFNHEARERLLRTGQKEHGIKHLEEVRTPRGLEWLFNLSLMKPTEGFNRITAMYAGRGFLAEAVARLPRNKQGDILTNSRQYKKMAKGMREDFKLSDTEIDVIGKYGLDPTKFAEMTKDVILEKGIKATYDRAMNKIDVWSGINTQGGTASALVPYWFNKPMAKPFLLFQRMAYAATFNLTRNVIKPMNLNNYGKGANFLPLVRYVGASTMGGYGLMKVYEHFLGVQPPNANDPKWKQMMNYMWKAEMLGIVSEAMSPFQGDKQMTTSLYPAIHKNALLLNENFWNVVGDKKTPYQGFTDSAKGIISAYNQTARIANRKFNKYNENYLKTKRLLKDFKKARGIEEPVIDFISTRSKYYRDFRDAFNKKTPREAGRKFLAAYFAITDSFLKESSGYTLKGAQKQARAVMKSQIKNLNPNNLSKERGGKVISNYHDFMLNYLKPGIGTRGNKKLYNMVLNSEKQYHYKWREVQKEIANLIKERGLQSFSNIKHTQRKVIL